MIKLINRRRTADRSGETPLYILSLYLVLFGLLGLVIQGIQSGVWNHLFAWLTIPALPKGWATYALLSAWLGGCGLTVNAAYCFLRRALRNVRQRKAADKGKPR